MNSIHIKRASTTFSRHRSIPEI